MESESNLQQSGKKKRDRRPWSTEEDESLLDILIEAVNQGQRLDNGIFKSHTLKSAETKMDKKFPGCGIKVKPHIESAMKRLRNSYNTIYDMLNQSGFGWDDEKKMIKVDSEDVWTEYIKSHPNAACYKNKLILNFDKLSLAFGKDRATGKGSVTPGDVVEELDQEEVEQDYATNEEEYDIGIDLTQSTSVNQSYNKRKHEQVESQSKKKNRGAQPIANSISELGKTFGKFLEQSSKRMGSVANRLGVGKDVFDDSRSIMNELKKMDLSEQQLFAAAEKILSVPHRLHMFWGSDDDDRLAFVMSLIE